MTKILVNRININGLFDIKTLPDDMVPQKTKLGYTVAMNEVMTMMELAELKAELKRQNKCDVFATYTEIK